MVNERVSKTDNYWYEGLVVSNPSPLEIHVSSGKFYVDHEERVEDEVTGLSTVQMVTEVDEYPEFSFDVIPDTELDVIYDVYLLDLPSKSGQIVHVDRTEIGADQFAFYTGTDVLRFTLMSFLVPANTTDLKNITITVNKVVKNVEDSSEQQITE